MEVTVEEVSSLTRKLTIVLPEAEVTKELNAAYSKLKGEVKLKGFRRGKVPRTILEKNYGPRVKQEVGEKLVQATYFDAVEQEKLDPVVHPEVREHSFDADGSFRYIAEVDIRPEFELIQYKGLAIDKPEVLVTDVEVDEELERLRREMAPLRSVEDRPVQQHDLVVLDFQGFHNDEPVKHVRGDDVSVDVGAGRQGAEFEAQLIGLSKGEESSRTIEFPADNANPMLAGKTIDFRCTIRDIKERVLAALDDEFAKDVDDSFSTLVDLQTSIRQRIEGRKQADLEGELSDRVMRTIIDANRFDVPERLVQYEIQEYLKDMESKLQQSGLTFESAGVNLQEAAENYREIALKRVTGDFILKKVAELEEIKVEEDEINAGFERVARQYNMSVSEVKGFFKRREDMLPFLNELLNEKVLKFLRDAADYTIVSAADPLVSDPAASDSANSKDSSDAGKNSTDSGEDVKK